MEENSSGGLPRCPVCSNPLILRVARGRKSGKPFIMLRCGLDGRHFRGFVADQDYVQHVFDAVENVTGG